MWSRERLRAAGALAVLAVLAACGGGAAAAPEAVTTSEATTATPDATVPAPSVPPGVQEVALVVDGSVRTYRRYVPPILPIDEPTALVVDLHGFASKPVRQDALSGWSALAGDEGFVVAQPAATGGVASWDSAPGTAGAVEDLALIKAVVDDVASAVAIDPGRVYLSGFSNGGGMANRVACDAADLVSAIGTVAGAYVDTDGCEPLQPVAVVSFHGTADVVVPYDGAGGVFPPIAEWAAGWAERNGCAPVAERVPVSGDTVRDAWGSCESGVAVVVYTVEGGRHAWPGTESPGLFAGTDTIDATALMWAFFEDHQRSS